MRKRAAPIRFNDKWLVDDNRSDGEDEGSDIADQNKGIIQHLRFALEQMRKEKGLSQKKLGAILGIGQTGYSSFERGRTILRGKSLEKAFQVVEEWSEYNSSIQKPSPILPDANSHCEDTKVPTVLCDAYCSKCNSFVPGANQGMLFCGCCGTLIVLICHKCGHRNTDSDARFCSRCGVPLA